jgi:hypothetical protein
LDINPYIIRNLAFKQKQDVLISAMYLQFHKHPFYCDIQTIYENAILSGNGEAYLPWQGDVTQIFLGSNTPHLQPTSGWLLSHHRLKFQRSKPPKTSKPMLPYRDALNLKILYRCVA